MIAIVDYGMGNRRSVEKALEHVGAQPVITADHDAIRAADGVVLPGVGAFPRGDAQRLRALGLDEVLRERARGRACRCSASASACSCCSSAPTSTRAPPGLGLLAGDA